jgi:ABC-2 type transport system ATP-binding protein
MRARAMTNLSLQRGAREVLTMLTSATHRAQTVEEVSQRLAIELEDVSRSFGTVEALRHVSFAIPQGQAVALLGPNGAGKTTAIGLMLGLRRPSHGQVRLFGLDPRDRRARSRCGCMLQESGVPLNLTVREIITLFRSYYPHPLPLAQVLEIAGLQKKAMTHVGSLSGGQRQRLYFALAICGDPDVLFLDEPTTGLDVEARRHFWEQLRAFRQQGKTIVLTTHYLEEADTLADRIILLDHGRVRADAPPALLKAQVTNRRIAFEVSEPLPAGFFDQLPVSQLEIQGHRVSLLTPQLETVLRALFTQPAEITNLTITEASLEEAFLQLTRVESEAKGG